MIRKHLLYVVAEIHHKDKHSRVVLKVPMLIFQTEEPVQM
jgi:hypothetical protein